MSIIISDLSRYNIYTATAGQTVFTYSFPIYVNTEVKVYQIAVGTTGDDATDLLTLTTHYSVTGVGVAGGGTVVLVTGAPIGTTILIVGDTTRARTSQFALSFTAEDLNTDLNKLLLMIQDLRTITDHLIPKYDYCTNAQTGDRHLPQLGASQIWQKNVDNTAIVATTITEASGWSALRAELASKLSGGDGALLIGYYDALLGQLTLKAKLDLLATKVELAADLVLVNAAIAASNAAIIVLQGKTNTATTTNQGIVYLASVTDVVTATDESKPVVPSTVKNSPSCAKAWGRFDLNGTLLESNNVTSVSHDASGIYTITLTNAMSSANYCVIGSLSPSGDVTHALLIENITANTFQIKVWSTGGGFHDTGCTFAVFGTLT